MINLQSKYETFEPLLQQFCEETVKIEIDGDFSTIFLPHTMVGYGTAPKKVFYFGRDTNGWNKTKELMQFFRDNQLNKYIDDNSTWINQYGFLDYNNNAALGFWTLVINLHLHIKGVNEIVRVDDSLYDSDFLDLLNDFGYGNTNSIEIKQSLQNQGIWQNLSVPAYLTIKEKSLKFDKLKYTIQAYKPDLIFIFNWSANADDFLEGLNYTVTKLDVLNNHFWVYDLYDTKTKLIWTIHPRTLYFNKTTLNKIIDIILNHI